MPDLAKTDTDLGHCWAPEEERPWGSRKGAKAGIWKTKPCWLPVIGCWGLARMRCSSAFPLPPESLPLRIVLVALLLPCPPALEEKAQREITAGFIRSKYYADFCLGNLPDVQREGIMHGVFWLWIKKITEKLTARWLSQYLEGSGWDTLERNSLHCLASFNDFHVLLTPLCAQVLEGSVEKYRMNKCKFSLCASRHCHLSVSCGAPRENMQDF